MNIALARDIVLICDFVNQRDRNNHGRRIENNERAIITIRAAGNQSEYLLMGKPEFFKNMVIAITNIGTTMA